MKRRIQQPFVWAGFLIAISMFLWLTNKRSSTQSEHAVRIAQSEVVHKIYPMSVVPGGVYSAQEAEAASTKDLTVRTHYSSLRLDRLRSTRLPATTLKFVSFKKRGEIFWTRKAFPLAEGESILASDSGSLRARCGNRLSEIAMEPTLPDGEADPEFGELDTPIDYTRNITGAQPSLQSVDSRAPSATPSPSGQEAGKGNPEPVIAFGPLAAGKHSPASASSDFIERPLHPIASELRFQHGSETIRQMPLLDLDELKNPGAPVRPPLFTTARVTLPPSSPDLVNVSPFDALSFTASAVFAPNRSPVSIASYLQDRVREPLTAITESGTASLSLLGALALLVIRSTISK